MSILSPKDYVLYFSDNGYYQDNSAQLGDKVVRMIIEAPMGASAREGGGGDDTGKYKKRSFLLQENCFSKYGCNSVGRIQARHNSECADVVHSEVFFVQSTNESG
jgi:hypothetical protein